MKTFQPKYLIAVLALSALAQPAANAASFFNGWSYAIDSQDDGSPSSGGIFEYRGLALKVDGSKVYVAMSSQMPQAGNPWGGALNGAVNHGDLFLNFSGHNLATAASFNDPSVFALRFDPLNDSLGNVGGSNVTVGVFGNVTVSSLTTSNSGYATLADYAGGWGRTVDAMADLEDSVNAAGDVRQYLSGGAQYPNMLSGTKLGDIAMLDRLALASMGLDFGHFSADPGGNNVWGMSFDRNLVPDGDFIMHVFEECINDGMALRGTTAVPEPGTIAMGVGGLLGLGMLMRRRRK
jgi:uncharacterized protein (TIGR03382 family)